MRGVYFGQSCFQAEEAAAAAMHDVFRVSRLCRGQSKGHVQQSHGKNEVRDDAGLGRKD